MTGCAGRGTVATAPIDPEAPAISFDRPANDTTVTRGERISFAVTIIGKRDLVSVRADVTGALNFQFPAAVPADSTFTTILRVETGEARGDSLQVRVIATDEAGRTGEGRRLVRLQ